MNASIQGKHESLFPHSLLWGGHGGSEPLLSTPGFQDRSYILKSIINAEVETIILNIGASVFQVNERNCII